LRFFIDLILPAVESTQLVSWGVKTAGA